MLAVLMSLSTVLLPDRRPGREATQGSRPDPHHQPTEAPPSNPTCTGAGYPHEPPQPLCVPQTLPRATVRPRWSSGPIGPCWAGYASLWRVSAAGSSTHARDVGVVARCRRALWRRRGLPAGRLGGCARRCASLSLLLRLLRARRRLAVTPRRPGGVSVTCLRTPASCQGGRDRPCAGGGDGVGSAPDTFAPTERCSAETLPMLL